MAQLECKCLTDTLYGFITFSKMCGTSSGPLLTLYTRNWLICLHMIILGLSFSGVGLWFLMVPVDVHHNQMGYTIMYIIWMCLDLHWPVWRDLILELYKGEVYPIVMRKIVGHTNIMKMKWVFDIWIALSATFQWWESGGTNSSGHCCQMAILNSYVPRCKVCSTWG